MQMYIPEIGDKLKLSETWKFTLVDEHRNTSIIEAFGLDDGQGYRHSWYRGVPGRTWPFGFNAGTVLKVDRIYIRKGAANYSSVSFYVMETEEEELKGISWGKRRFWAKLKDVNTMVFEPVK